MTPTSMQEEIIKTSTSNIIVSAAAGSGKTSVLTERVISLLRDKNYNLDELIILTFTDQAAKEMKDRIIGKLSKENSRLQNELHHIDEAHIQTFDSFCHDFVSRYSEYSSFPQDFEIGDNAIFSMKKKEYLSKILESYFKNPTPIFDSFIDSLNIKSDRDLYKRIIDYYDQVLNICDYRTYLDNYQTYEYSIEHINEIKEEYINNLRETLEFLSNMTVEISDEKSQNCFDKVTSEIKDILDIKDTKEFIRAINDYQLQRFPNSKLSGSEKEEFASKKKIIQDTLKSIKVNYTFITDEDIIEPFNKRKDVTAILIEILLKLDDMMSLFKSSHNIYSFLDVQRETIKILKEHKEISSYYKTNIKEILIDEYQDTNSIGNTIVSLISNNNVMVVGDIKQSIYRFRNAEPKIFEEKFKQYQTDINGKTFILRENFRSRHEEVIIPVNTIFENIMNYPGVNMPYLNERLVYGFRDYDNMIEDKNGFFYLTFDKEHKEDEYNNIANDIKYRISKNQYAYDKEQKKFRKAKYSDFLILTLTNAKAIEVAKQFKFNGVPSKVYVDKNFSKSKEIIFIKNCLYLVSIIDKGQIEDDSFNLALLSILRSFVIREKDDKIAEYLNRNEYKTNIEAMNHFFPDLLQKFNSLVTLLHEKNAYYCLKEIISMFDVYSKLSSLKDIEEKEIKLNLIQEKVKVMADSLMSLDDIVSYFDYLNENSLDISQKLNDFDNLDCVNIMTIHKSKGLEKPFVYVANLYNNKKKSTPIFDQKYGFYITEPLSISEVVFNEEHNKEQRKEIIRLLYVALTRARESVTLVFSPDVSPYYGTLLDANTPQKMLSMGNTFTLKEVPNMMFTKDSVNMSNDIDESPHQKLLYKELNLKDKEEIVYTKASHELDSLDEDVLKMIEKGNELHSAFEKINFLSDIEYQMNILKYDDYTKDYIRAFKAQEIFNSPSIREFHELPYFKDNNRGIMDYIIEKDSKFIIVDFKLKNIDNPLYLEQLKTYKAYLETRTSKTIETFLYSIIGKELRRINT